jgi:tetratricopeptide (TPR) repeat protein
MAIAADPQHVDALYERAVLHYADGELDAALARLDAALQYSPRAANAYYVRGLIYNARGEHTRAINEFTQALTLRSDYAEALLARAAAYHASGDTISADADLDRLSQMELDETLEKAVSVLRLQLGHIQ